MSNRDHPALRDRDNKLRGILEYQTPRCSECNQTIPEGDA